MKHIHILGICGTFMGSLAQLAKQQGYRVTGADLDVYPPMSTQLEAAGIELIEGWDPQQLDVNPDIIVVGNAISRGNPVIEAALDRMLPYVSGPQWLAEHILPGKWVLAVAGTHGKTTTSSMLAWILDYAHMAPGYLIGGVPKNFSSSARMGMSDFFVIEADEYDSAFFDKRSKFVHYRPRTLVINNLEFDHADIFDDLPAIQKQFHHLVRTVAANGLIVLPHAEPDIDEVIAQGCWTPIQEFSVSDSPNCLWHVEKIKPDGSCFGVYFSNSKEGEVEWPLVGDHNLANALAAIAAARNVGVPPMIACQALCEFEGVKRRMEVVGKIEDWSVYDDFAHHPTAIQTTIDGLRARVGDESIRVVIEPRSNTMKQGVHRDRLIACLERADQVFWFESPDMEWSLSELLAPHSGHQLAHTIDSLVELCVQNCAEKEHFIIMSNGGFSGIHNKIIKTLQAKALCQ